MAAAEAEAEAVEATAAVSFSEIGFDDEIEGVARRGRRGLAGAGVLDFVNARRRDRGDDSIA